MKKLFKCANVAAICFIYLLAGCDRAEVIRGHDGVQNVREMPGNYIMYEIEEGTVTCREHMNKQKMTCWKNS